MSIPRPPFPPAPGQAPGGPNIPGNAPPIGAPPPMQQTGVNPPQGDPSHDPMAQLVFALLHDPKIAPLIIQMLNQKMGGAGMPNLPGAPGIPHPGLPQGPQAPGAPGGAPGNIGPFTQALMKRGG